MTIFRRWRGDVRELACVQASSYGNHLVLDQVRDMAGTFRRSGVRLAIAGAGGGKVTGNPASWVSVDGLRDLAAACTEVADMLDAEEAGVQQAIREQAEAAERAANWASLLAEVPGLM